MGAGLSGAVIAERASKGLGLKVSLLAFQFTDLANSSGDYYFVLFSISSFSVIKFNPFSSFHRLISLSIDPFISPL